MYLDTHVVVWLYEDGVARIPQQARALVEAEPLVISPMVTLELALLHEIGRMAPTPSTVLSELRRSIDLRVSQLAFGKVTEGAAALSWSRDPFDRVICGQARADGALLLTRDRRIRANLDLARWD